MTKSYKQISIEKDILDLLDDREKEIANYLFLDKELAYIQNYANSVSIKRLGYNDHGPVHMRMSALNALKAFTIMDEAGIEFNLPKENHGTVSDSKISVLMAAIMHDLGMSVARDRHELVSVELARPIADRILAVFYPDEFEKRIIMRSMIIECIIGHMASQKIHSYEAGLVLVGDGCDMEHGRARIPQLLSIAAKRGDIHRYSSTSIQAVRIIKGQEKPVRIEIDMKQSVGFFQIEEVLMPKILSSPIKEHIELYAEVTGREKVRYL